MMVLDCFPFLNEHDLLEIRLHELDPVVDKFIIVEATRTFSNKHKKLVYPEQEKRHAKFAKKVRYVVMDDYTGLDTSDAWVLEHAQKQVGLDLALDMASQGDLLIYADCLWAVIDEESEHRGAYALEQGKFRADACIVTEPSDLRLLLGCKGTAPVRVDLEGILAHGSNPWLGVNAIEKAARVILTLARLEPRSLYIPELDMRVQGSVNVGVIKGLKCCV